MAKPMPGVATATYNADDRTNVQLAMVGQAQRYDKHILTVVCTGTPSAGTVTVRVKALNSTRFIALKDEFGVPVTISLATADHCVIDGPIDAVEMDIASLATATDWKAVLCGIAY